MARIEITGLDDVMAMFDKLEAMPDQVMRDMVNAGSDVAVKAIKGKALTLINGPYANGTIAKAVRKRKEKKTKDGISQEIGFAGNMKDKYHKKATPVSTVAFFNEVGSQKVRARNFVKVALAETENEIIAAEERVLDEHMKNI